MTEQSKDGKVSYEQKSKISSMINTLSESKMVMALKIIRDNMPELKVQVPSYFELLRLRLQIPSTVDM